MLGLLDRFRKKKKTNIETTKTISELEQLCGDDKETYEALLNTMFLDPRKVGTSMKEAADNAKKFEKEKDFVKARTWYEIAGGLAIYEGNVKKVVEFFSEIVKISPDTKYTTYLERGLLKNPEKAVAKAQEYYKQYLESKP
jgi:tetratricopeptide (TPR) repeat protein